MVNALPFLVNIFLSSNNLMVLETVSLDVPAIFAISCWKGSFLIDTTPFLIVPISSASLAIVIPILCSESLSERLSICLSLFLNLTASSSSKDIAIYLQTTMISTCQQRKCDAEKLILGGGNITRPMENLELFFRNFKLFFNF